MASIEVGEYHAWYIRNNVEGGISEVIGVTFPAVAWDSRCLTRVVNLQTTSRTLNFASTSKRANVLATRFDL